MSSAKPSRLARHAPDWDGPLGQSGDDVATVDGLSAEPGSFRDRVGRVFYRHGAVFRALSAEALGEWEILATKPYFSRMMAEGKVIRTERVDWSELDLDSLPHNVAPPLAWAGLLRHDLIPFVSYPHEWSFGMLKDAALLQLDLLLAGLDADMTLKDASSFNVQWRGTEPTFIDVTSIEQLRPGEPWRGYRQFCEMLLYPLMLQAYKDVAFQTWLRGRIDGIPVEEMNRLMSARDQLRPGVFTHVFAQARLGGIGSGRDLKQDLRTAGFDKSMIVANARGLRGLVGGLGWNRSRSAWSDYATDHSYTEADYERKQSFVRAVAQSRPWGLVWDLGCNTGTFSRIAAENARYVVAMDADHLAIEQLYQALKGEGTTRILPLVNNLADPTPALGWRLRERKSLPERGRPELTLALALIHHLVIGANLPLGELIGWLAELGTDLVIEFVTREDDMVKMLLRNRVDNYADYDLGYFEDRLAASFLVDRREPLASGTRILYFARNRRGATA